MKKALATLMILILALGAIALVGCGGEKEETKVVETGEEEVKVETEKGDIEINKDTPSEEEMDIPVYPDAEAVENAAGSVTEGGSTFAARQYITDDSVDKVLAWYRDELSGEEGFTDMSTAQGGLMSYQSEDLIKTVTVAPGTGEQAGRTLIVLSTATGEMPKLIQ
jgi:hypothetical protein